MIEKYLIVEFDRVGFILEVHKNSFFNFDLADIECAELNEKDKTRKWEVINFHGIRL